MSRPAKFTKEELEAALRANDFDPILAAIALQVNPSTVYRAARRYGVEIPEPRRIAA